MVGGENNIPLLNKLTPPNIYIYNSYYSLTVKTKNSYFLDRSSILLNDLIKYNLLKNEKASFRIKMILNLILKKIIIT